MTRISGYNILETPCCGRYYVAPRFLSISLCYIERWTDGWYEGAWMSNDEGLRQCSCGQYFIWHKDMRRIGSEESTNLSSLAPLPTHRLPQAVRDTSGSRLEIPARLAYWRNLNQRYRDAFYALQEQQKLTAKRLEFDWYLANPDRRTWWQKLLRYPAPAYPRPANQPSLMPPFEPTTAQKENMQLLCELIAANHDVESDPGLKTLAEIQRQLGRFDDAITTLKQIQESKQDGLFKLILRLAEGKNSAPALLA